MGSYSKGIEFTVYKGSVDGNAVQSTTRRDKLNGEEVLLKVTHSSLCGTDEHYLRADMCLGHECAGVVEKLGPDVKTLKIGDNVAFGYQKSSCGACAKCRGSLETFCPQRGFYGVVDLDVGSMASHAVFRESFLYKVPPGMSNATASALMCGGATVFNVLDMYDVKPAERVGIVGVGGLGHLAIQFAAKWGCEVVVFSGTESKREVATELGAHEFYTTGAAEDFKGIEPIDHLMVTTSAQVPWDLYLSVMASPGTVYPLSVVDEGDLRIPYMAFLMSGLRIQASIIAPKVIQQRMLDFAARHQIRAIVQPYHLDLPGIKQAMADLHDGKMRYKAVLFASNSDLKDFTS